MYVELRTALDCIDAIADAARRYAEAMTIETRNSLTAAVHDALIKGITPAAIEATIDTAMVSR
jgi:hypothetical protein